ncbi:glycosyltransferase [Aestuariirhabdus sp. Z084]|uniref:glycosyltransferase n=1 Tax=Aestuariirhabdus haliotis TaxID=2918751 RepID=UPI00201B357B|nr:glycosyltransferase family 2 protein [Aestuariirhabdus haliotis]MCL6414690.1 glycosyltransferase [Aestuariirhabdus haliotis]MCL6418622.1 glycosyltransferase [Aestuariirhabdus haliotis]
MRLEVIICTHDRSTLLQRTLRSVEKAAPLSKSDLEITIIANNCHDDTEEMIKDLSNEYPYPIRLFTELKPGKSNALNKAIEVVKGNFIIFIDDDHRIDYHFFESIEELLEKRNTYSLFCGKIIPDWDGIEPTWIHNIEYPVYPLPIPHYDLGNEELEITINNRLPGGGNLIMAKEVLERTGDFNVSLGPSGHNLGGGEDGDYVRRALTAGFRLLYSPGPIQYHWADSERLSLLYLIRKAYSRSRSAAYINIEKPALPPRFLYTKLLINICNLLIPVPLPRLRFYLMRTSSTLGEISAYLSRFFSRNTENSR